MPALTRTSRQIAASQRNLEIARRRRRRRRYAAAAAVLAAGAGGIYGQRQVQARRNLAAYHRSQGASPSQARKAARTQRRTLRQNTRAGKHYRQGRKR